MDFFVIISASTITIAIRAFEHFEPINNENMKINHKYICLVLALFTLFLMPRCNSDRGGVRDVNPSEAEKIVKDNLNNTEFVILDVRTPGEFNSGHLAGAVNIDYNADDFASKIGLLDKSRIYLVYCASGYRSAGAVSMMKDQGFKSISNLTGGLSNWAAQNLPVLTE